MSGPSATRFVRRPGGALKLVVHLAGQDVAGPPWQSGPARDHPQFVGALLDLVRCRVGVSLGTDDGQVGVQEQRQPSTRTGSGIQASSRVAAGTMGLLFLSNQWVD